MPSLPGLIEAIEASVATYNQSSTPLVWMAKAADILAKDARARQKLEM